MSDHHHELDVDRLTRGQTLDRSRFAAAKLVALGLGVLGLIVSAVLFVASPATRASYSYSWLWAFYVFGTIAFGGVFWTLLHHLTNASWGVAIRRIKENLACTVPLFLVLALPFAIPAVQENLWEWFDAHRDAAVVLKEQGGQVNLDTMGAFFRNTHTGEVYAEHPHMALLGSKMVYLNAARWYGFVFGGLVLLCWFAWRLRKMSLRQDEVGGTRLTFKLRGASAWMMAVYALIVTFLSIDLLKGLDYTWYSTMWGVYTFAGSAGASMATLILVAIVLRRTGHLEGIVTPEHFHIMGKLLLAFTMFWAYTGFSQFMLIWYANIPEETTWFRLRNTGPWWWVSFIGLLFLRFLVPFLVLLQAWIKKNFKLMVPFCLYFIAVHAMDLYITVVAERGPSLTSTVVRGRALNPDAGLHPQLFIQWAWAGDILAFVTIGSLFVWVLIVSFSRNSLYPRRDPRLVESLDTVN